MNHKVLYTLIAFTVIFVACNQKKAAKTAPNPITTKDSIQQRSAFGIHIDSLNVQQYKLKRGESPASIFYKLGLSSKLADQITDIPSNILDPTRIQADKNYFTLATIDSIPCIKYVVFTKSMTEFAVLTVENDSLMAHTYSKPITYKQKLVQGSIQSSLWNSIIETGADPLLAMKLADVYAWQIDFFDIKAGDSFIALYNEAYIDDTTALEIASIKGARFIHQSKIYNAIPFTQDSVAEYYDEAGNSLRKAFLKAPLDFFRITSRFSNARFHPILKRYRAHHGIDYAAPTGTPVRSIGSGKVTHKAYQRGGGNYIKVTHNATYSTTYMHLSGFAKGLAPGKTVQQGEVIGYVGSTGLSTGPHLDFRVFKNGKAINPLDLEAPPMVPIQPAYKDSFQVAKQPLLHLFDSLQLQMKKKIIHFNDTTALSQ